MASDFAEPPPRPARAEREPRPFQGERERRAYPPRDEGDTPAARPPRAHDAEFGARPPRTPKPPRSAPDAGMETYRVEVGHMHGVKPGNIVGAIANEAGLESRFIGRIDIHDDHSILDLPEGMPQEVMSHLQKTWVVGQQLRISRWDGSHAPSADAPKGRFRPPGARPHAARPGRPGGGPPKPHRKGPPKPHGG
ncbi:DbpA RNA binding domain-containing protein [Pseudoxanthomonas kaohsiungensis]|uniref:DbpA RNA binding domain-containing protein n=1 Tax=Pseudoxanthomonas kaohsiungensis TaxID=283923 RepID=A0ABW3LZQ6_9GAMM